MHIPIRVSGTNRTDLGRPPLLSGVKASEEWRVASQLAFCRTKRGLERSALKGQSRTGGGSLFGYPPRSAHYQYEEATSEAVNRRSGGSRHGTRVAADEVRTPMLLMRSRL